MPVVVFLSAVSSEFQYRDERRPQKFQPYRDVLANALRRLGSNYTVIVQEDVAQGFGDLLETLDEEVSRSDLIVHLVGNAAGAVPEEATVRRLRTRHQDFLSNEPELSAALRDAADVSYTQWEVYCAFHHSTRRLVFVADENAPRSPKCRARKIEPSQARHLQRLKQTGEHREGFADQRDLALKVVTSVARYGLGLAEITQRPAAEAIAAAREDAAGLANAISENIRKPDKKYVAELDEIGVERFLQAVDTAALQRELDRRSALEIAHEHREALRKVVEVEPDAADLKELAFAEMAVGHFFDAIRAAQRCAELAEQQMTADSTGYDEHHQLALNAYLLLHDAAMAVNRRDEAVAALKRGCELIDQDRDPVLWADYNEQLARYYLDHGHFARAEELIDEITDIREDHQPETQALANSLLLWCELLNQQADFQGVIDVSKRAERMFAEQTSPIMSGISAAIGYRALALKATNRLAEAEPLMRRALAIDEQSYGDEHPRVAIDLNNLASLLQDTNRLAEAEPLMRRALAIVEQSMGTEHPYVANCLNNLAQLLQHMAKSSPAAGSSRAAADLLAEAEPLMRRALEIFVQFGEATGHQHPYMQDAIGNYRRLLQEMGLSEEDMKQRFEGLLEKKPEK